MFFLRIGVGMEQVIGHFDHAKSGATCAIMVCPMRVTKMLSDDRWNESHRWLQLAQPKRAATRVAHPDRAQNIAGFEEA